MLKHELLTDDRVLVVRPTAPLEQADFRQIAAEVDPVIEEGGDLAGLLVDAPEFAGWKDFAALVAHLKFVRDHHRHIKRVAAVSDSGFLSVAPRVARHFVAAEIRAFPSGKKEEALAWLRAGA